MRDLPPVSPLGLVQGYRLVETRLCTHNTKTHIAERGDVHSRHTSV